MKKKATLMINPVTWTNNIPLKFQASVEYPVNEERTIRIIGSPEPTKSKALNSLFNEESLWEKAMQSFREVLAENIALKYENSN